MAGAGQIASGIALKPPEVGALFALRHAFHPSNHIADFRYSPHVPVVWCRGIAERLISVVPHCRTWIPSFRPGAQRNECLQVDMYVSSTAI